MIDLDMRKGESLEINCEAKKIIGDEVMERLFQLRHSESLTVLAMGDSSVFGVGDGGSHTKSIGAGWAGRLAHDIGARRFINVARNGARCSDLLENQLKAAFGMKANLVLICIGTNDVLRGDFSPVQIERHLRHFVQTLNSIRSTPVFLGLPDPLRTAPGPISIRRILHRRVRSVNHILRKICKEENAAFVATWNLPSERSHWHVDRMHPSPKGHQSIANHARAELALLRRSKQTLACDVSASRYSEISWLLTNGLKWFLRRSIDLIPGLIWLVVSDKIQNRHASNGEFAKR